MDWKYTMRHIAGSGARIAQAVRGYPLKISVYCHASKSPRTRTGIGKEDIEVIGHAEIDLSPLLLKQIFPDNSASERYLLGFHHSRL